MLAAGSAVVCCLFFVSAANGMERNNTMKKSLVQKLGLLGVVSFLLYALAVIFSPLAYPGYHPLAQAVSDLSAADAPSLALWNQLSAGYNACEVVCATIVCVGIQGQKTKLLRAGIYLFAIMEWISALGYRMFPLSTSGYAGTALLLMLTGALGMKLVPADFFGVVERFSVFAATGFNAALGVHLFCAKPETESRSR